MSRFEKKTTRKGENKSEPSTNSVEVRDAAQGGDPTSLDAKSGQYPTWKVVLWFAIPLAAMIVLGFVLK